MRGRKARSARIKWRVTTRTYQDLSKYLVRAQLFQFSESYKYGKNKPYKEVCLENIVE